MTDLNAALLDAHARGDKHALVILYETAANIAADTDATCFFLTQAYVFALDVNHPSREPLFDQLKRHGRV